MSVEKYTDIIRRYLSLMSNADWQGVVALYAADATLEDPVGSAPITGTEALADFYRRNTCRPMTLQLEGPIRVAGSEAAFPFSASLEWEGRPTKIHVIDVFKFNDEHQIVSMRAFVGPHNFVSA